MSNAADVEHILKTNYDNYVKGPDLRKNLGSILGNGIFIANHNYSTDEGRNWRAQRKLTSRIFTGNNFRTHFMKCFVEHGADVVELLKARVGDKHGLDAQTLFFNYTLDCIGKLGFGTDLGCLAGRDNSFAKAFARGQILVFNRFLFPFWRLPICKLFLPSERELRGCIREIDR